MQTAHVRLWHNYRCYYRNKQAEDYLQERENNNNMARTVQWPPRQSALRVGRGAIDLISAGYWERSKGGFTGQVKPQVKFEYVAL